MGTIADYIDEFVARASLVPNVSDRQCLGFFLNGLREDIHPRNRSHKTTDLYRTMKLAREIERQRMYSSKGREKMWMTEGIKEKGISHGLETKALVTSGQKAVYGSVDYQKKDGPPPKPPENPSCLSPKTLTLPLISSKQPNH